MNIKSFDHICIQTDCYAESLEFYTKILGFELLKDTSPFHDREHNTWLHGGGMRIELQTPKINEVLNKWSSKNAGPVHFAVLVEDVKLSYLEILQKGYNKFKQKSGNALYEVDGGILLKVRAPEGTEIEIRQNAI